MDIVRTLTAALAAGVLWLGGQAQALVVTYDLQSSSGPITLRFEADDDDADERVRFRRNVADISSILDITLTYRGVDYTLIGAVDPDTSLLDRDDNTLSVIVADAVRPWANTLTSVQLTFGQSMRGIRTIGDFFAYLDSAIVLGGQLGIQPTTTVPLPGGVVLFLTGAGALFAKRSSRF